MYLSNNKPVHSKNAADMIMDSIQIWALSKIGIEFKFLFNIKKKEEKKFKNQVYFIKSTKTQSLYLIF